MRLAVLPCIVRLSSRSLMSLGVLQTGSTHSVDHIHLFRGPQPLAKSQCSISHIPQYFLDNVGSFQNPVNSSSFNLEKCFSLFSRVSYAHGASQPLRSAHLIKHDVISLRSGNSTQLAFCSSSSRESTFLENQPVPHSEDLPEEDGDVEELENSGNISGTFQCAESNGEVRAPPETHADGGNELESSGGRQPQKSGADGLGSGRIRAQSERKKRGPGLHVEERVPDLLTVPGIGPRNMEKLVAKGIGKLAELKQLYLDKFFGSGSEKMVEYLQSSVGILHKNHAQRITAYIRDTVDQELKADEDPTMGNIVKQKKRLTFCVEGNISVGKTTFLQKITNEALELRDLVEIVPEPVAKWQDVGPEHFNILDAFYAEPQRYAYTFQNYVFVTRLMQEQESSRGLKPLRLMERSVFSDRMVFVRAVHEAKWMNEMEISIYDSWFDPVISALPGLVPDGFIYLRASPDTCFLRLQTRKRPEEQSVTIDYLRGLHEKHEQWLFPAQTRREGIFSLSQWPSELNEFLSSRIRDRVFYLEGDNVHSCIRKVPALVLDCEASIDFTRDSEAKAEYARQVAEFFEFVQKTKYLEEVAGNMASSRLILPQTSGLLGPDGSLLHSHALNSTEMRRHASSFAS